MGRNQITTQQLEPVRHRGKIVMTVGETQRTSDRHQSDPAGERTRVNVGVKTQLESQTATDSAEVKNQCGECSFLQKAGMTTDN